MSADYYSDEEHIAHWLKVSKTPEGTAKYFEEYVFGVPDFDVLRGKNRRPPQAHRNSNAS